MFEGDKTRLRSYRNSDYDDLMVYINDIEVLRNLFIGPPYPLTEKDEKNFLDKISAFNKDYNFAIETKSGCKYIGGCGISDIDWKNRNCQVGIFIGSKDYRGKGYGTDALQTLVNFVFEQLGLKKFSLEVFAFNERAQKSYKKIGFETEGVFKNHIYRDGRFHDVIRMAVLN